MTAVRFRALLLVLVLLWQGLAWAAHEPHPGTAADAVEACLVCDAATLDGPALPTALRLPVSLHARVGFGASYENPVGCAPSFSFESRAPPTLS